MFLILLSAPIGCWLTRRGGPDSLPEKYMEDRGKSRRDKRLEFASEIAVKRVVLDPAAIVWYRPTH